MGDSRDDGQDREGLFIRKELYHHPDPFWVRILRRVMHSTEPILDFFDRLKERPKGSNESCRESENSH